MRFLLLFLPIISFSCNPIAAPDANKKSTSVLSKNGDATQRTGELGSHVSQSEAADDSSDDYVTTSKFVDIGEVPQVVSGLNFQTCLFSQTGYFAISFTTEKDREEIFTPEKHLAIALENKSPESIKGIFKVGSSVTSFLNIDYKDGQNWSTVNGGDCRVTIDSFADNGQKLKGFLPVYQITGKIECSGLKSTSGSVEKYFSLPIQCDAMDFRGGSVE